MSSLHHTNPYFARAGLGDPATIEPIILLAHRCRLMSTVRPGESWGFSNVDHVHVWIDQTTAFVFVVKDGKACTLAEPAGIFPSDNMVASFKLMMDGATK